MSGNALHGYHWGSQASARKKHRTECESIAREAIELAGWEAPAKAKVSLHFCVKGARIAKRYSPRDPTNAVMSVKSLIDGIVDAGVISGDDFSHMSLGEVTLSKAEGPYIKVVVENLDG